MFLEKKSGRVRATDLQRQPSPGGGVSGISLHAGRAGYSSLEQEAGELIKSFVYLLHDTGRLLAR